MGRPGRENAFENDFTCSTTALNSSVVSSPAKYGIALAGRPSRTVRRRSTSVGGSPAAVDLYLNLPDEKSRGRGNIDGAAGPFRVRSDRGKRRSVARRSASPAARCGPNPHLVAKSGRRTVQGPAGIPRSDAPGPPAPRWIGRHPARATARRRPAPPPAGSVRASAFAVRSRSGRMCHYHWVIKSRRTRLSPPRM